MKKSLVVLFGILALILPLMFFGCSGDDGATGAAGAPGTPGTGTPGPPGPGVLASETCTICHSVGSIADLVAEHGKFLPVNQGTVTATINSVTFGAPAGDNVPVSVNFTFTATNSAGADITSSINLLTDATSDGSLDFVRFALAKLTAGTNGNADAWGGYVVTPGAGGSQYLVSRNGTLTLTAAPGTYTYTFPDNAVRVSDVYADNAVHRVAIQLSGFLAGSFNPDTNIARPVGNITADMVNPVGGGTLASPFSVPAGYPRKDVVTTAACNACHDLLAIHDGDSRRDTKYCVVCHNAKLETAAGGSQTNGNFVNLVHKIHTAQDLGPPLNLEFDATEVTYPILMEQVTSERPGTFGIRDVRNCTKCHQGGLDSGNWTARPTIEACGSCHVNVNFATGAGHLGGAYSNSSACLLCHTPGVVDTEVSHRTENLTPNNPTLTTGLDVFEYNITSVTVDNNVPVVEFRITINGSPLTIPADNTGKAIPPSGYSTNSSPSFLVAWALPQDNVTTPADYNNLNSPAIPNLTSPTATGNGAGQPPSVQLSKTVSTTTGAVTPGLPLTGGPSGYTARLTGAKFPAGAQMRAVALTGYFTQILGTDNVGRHTPSVVKAVTGDAVRRTVVKSGYVGGQPVGCLECHEIFEGHGGSRVNNVQVCVICHNPNLSSSGRTVNPALPIPQGTIDAHGTDPLQYPEATNNMKSLIHGIHAAPIRDNPFHFVRNRSNGLHYNWSEVTYPGNLRNCQKCHDGVTYDPDLPAGQLWSTERITTGITAETRADILAARAGMPNSTDLVTSPITAACYYCHDDSAAASHFVLNGADILSTRANALLTPTPAP